MSNPLLVRKAAVLGAGVMGAQIAAHLTNAMADFGLIKRPPGVTEAAHRERAARELIRFAEAGLRADRT